MKLNDSLSEAHTRARDESGATAMEYGLMLSLIAVAIMATVTLMSDALVAMYTTIVGSL